MGAVTTYDTVIERIADPQPECGFGEEGVLLTKHVQLWISIQNTSRHELIEHADYQWWQQRKDDVVER